MPSIDRIISAACAAGQPRLLKRVDIGIAVDTEGGLIVPILRNVGERGACELRAGLDRMRADAEARSIPPEELTGATITLSNFGMIGDRFASLVIVPPQVVIIGARRIGEWEWRATVRWRCVSFCRCHLHSIIAL